MATVMALAGFPRDNISLDVNRHHNLLNGTITVKDNAREEHSMSTEAATRTRLTTRALASLTHFPPRVVGTAQSPSVAHAALPKTGRRTTAQKTQHARRQEMSGEYGARQPYAYSAAGGLGRPRRLLLPMAKQSCCYLHVHAIAAAVCDALLMQLASLPLPQTLPARLRQSA